MMALAGFAAASSQFAEASYQTAPHIFSKVISCYEAVIYTVIRTIHFLSCSVSVSLCVNAWLFMRVHIETRRKPCMFLRHHPLAPSFICLSVYWNRVHHWSSIQSQLASAPQGSTHLHFPTPQSMKWVLEARTQVLVLARQVLTDGTISPACLSFSLKFYFHAIMHRFQVFEVWAHFGFASLVGWVFLFCFAFKETSCTTTTK